MKNGITLGMSYFGSRILRHIRTDMRRLKRLGFNFVIHTFSEYDLKFHRENIRDIVKSTQEAGLTVFLDPWGIGNVFGGEPFSDFVTDHSEDSCQVLDDGRHIHLACPNAPLFRDFMQEWLKAAIATGADGILWDEPHFHSPSYLKGVPGRWSCRCTHCQKLFESQYGKPLPLKETEAVRQFRAASLVDFLECLTIPTRNAGLKNILFLTAEKPVSEVIADWSILIRTKAIDIISTGPYWMWTGLPVESVRDYAELLKRIAGENGLDHLFWIQSCRIKNDRNDEIRQAFQMAYDAGMRHFALWGFEGCADESWIACENPHRVWRTAINTFRTLKHKTT